VAVAGWVGGVVVEEVVAGRRPAPVLARLAPSRDLDAFIRARTPAERHFAALDVLLGHPSPPTVDPFLSVPFSWDPGGSLWQIGWWSTAGRDIGYVEPPGFLTPEQRAAASEEWRRLTDAGPGPVVYCTRALSVARESPLDPRVPDLLYRAVQSTRFATDWSPGGTERIARASRRVFVLLHSRYARSEWARRTRYWYAGRN
jgi:hypothetical protein